MMKVDCWEEPNMLCVEVTGHAGYDVAGKDIVCAAVSMLMYTLRQRQQDLNAKPFECEMRSGYAKIKVPEISMRESYETVASGLKLLSEQYPENVEFTRY